MNGGDPVQSIAKKVSGAKVQWPLLLTWQRMPLVNFAKYLGAHFMRLNASSRAAFVLRIGVLAFCGLCTFVLGHPPAKADQAPRAYGSVQRESPVVTREDERQDIAIQQAQEWHQNQENWNAQTGAAMGKVVDRLTAVEQEAKNTDASIDPIATMMKIGFPAIGACTALAAALQFRKKV